MLFIKAKNILRYRFACARTGAGWLPVIGSCVSTYAVFTMQGIPMRLAILSSTCCWLANNIISGSIGGTLLEAVIATVNTYTIAHLCRPAKDRSAEPTGGCLPQ
nr:YgjV family protein [Geotalea sp. SG265]